MFPPGGGNDPRLKAVMTTMGRPNPGGLAQGGPRPMQPQMGAAPAMAGPDPNGGVPEGSVAWWLGGAVDAIAAARNDPSTIESLQGFFLALKQMAGAGQQSPAPDGQSPLGFGNAPGMSGQAAPMVRPRR